MKKLFLVDTSSLFFRAFYAIGPLSSPSGMPTNAIYGFLSMLIKLLREEKPEYLVFCYDRKEPSFRKDLYDAYKANRSEMPEDLAPQIPYIQKLAEVMGIPSVTMAGYEADDLIGTLTQIGIKKKMEVFIVSGDKDFAQLLTDHIYIYDTMKNTKMGPKEAIEKWGVRPDQFVDYLALCGDSSDNIPGVAGIGPKTAQKLIADFSSLKGIYENIDKVAGKSAKEKLIAHKENAFLSQKLVTIVTDVNISDNLEDYRRKPFDRAALMPMMQELNFKTIDKNIWETDFNPDAAPAAPLNPGVKNYAPTTAAEAAALAKSSSGAPVVKPSTAAQTSLNLEETEGHTAILLSSKILQDKFSESALVWGFSVGTEVFIAQQNHDDIYYLNLESKDLFKQIDELKFRWLGFDLKSLWTLLGLHEPICYWDSLLASYVLAPGESAVFEKVLEKHLQDMFVETINPHELLKLHDRLYKILFEKVNQSQFDQVLSDLDFPLSPLLYKMERHGIKIDVPLLEQQSRELSEEILDAEKNIFRLAGDKFNVGSPKQLGVVLFDKLKLPVIKKTKTGFSTDSDVLEKLRGQHDIVEFILKYRELAKLKSTYVDPLPQIMKADGRVHTHFNQALTTTGRLSSTDPNLQNIPIRTPRGAKIRNAFCAEKNKIFLSADYSQIELRILAHYSDDPNMKQAFVDDIDIHSATASEIFSVKLSDVNGDMRRKAKAVNFGIAYGQGAFGLAETLGISRSESSEIIKKYFVKFPGIRAYMDDIVRKAKEDGYVETLYQRRRYIKELQSSNMAIQKFGERAAINAPIQGTASDIVKKAMLVVDRQVKLDMILQVHDELIMEGSPEDIERLKSKVQSIMETIVQLKVPLKVNVGTGPNWGEAH